MIMRRAILVSLLFLLMAASPSLLRAQPGIQVIGGTKLDFGTIYRGDVVERNVDLKNTGTDTLVLGNVEVSCGCTGTVVAKDHIPPGDSGTLLIKFNSRNFTGPIHKTVVVNSNAKAEARTIIEFSGTVIDEIILQPQNFWFKDAEVGRTDSIVMTIKNNGHDELRLKSSRARLEGFSLRIPTEPLKPGETGTIVAVFTPGKEMPVIAESVFIETTNPRQPTLTVPIYGNVKVFKFE